MFKLHTLSIAKRLGLIIGSALLGVLLMAVLVLISERTLITEERKNSVRQNVEVAHAVIAHFQAQATQGKMTEDEAKLRAMEAVKSLRYSGKEYFWVQSIDSKMLMHPIKPDLNGKDLTQEKDANGKYHFIEFVNTVKAKGAGFVSYMWTKPGLDKPVPKVSYVQGFAPWGWIVGSGVYIDTIDALMAERMLGLSISALVLAAALLLISLVITRSLLKQLGGEPGYATSITQRIAAGDLSADIVLKSGDQSSLLHAIKTMRDSFAGIVAHVRQGAEGVSTASAEIASGNHDLSARTESQASALEQTAASMEELNSTVKQNADSARQANQLAQSASNVAVRGGEVVAQVVQTMHHINDSSKKIFDIISVIDGIAFQTNILALNAAVEAARAGEQGRGFAVVASEVRSLAGRSAEAAKEIKTLIGASVERVEQGSALVDQAGVTMTEVVGSIRRVTDIMGEISAASNEQSVGVSQVGEAVTQMDRVTQQNAALVEEMAAAASSLQSQAQDLVGTVAVFQLSPEAQQHRQPAARPAARTQIPSAPAFKRAPPKARVPAPAKSAAPAKLLATKPAALKKAPPAPSPTANNDEWETF
jgi:methyl-accepting chemotaxis protein